MQEYSNYERLQNLSTMDSYGAKIVLKAALRVIKDCNEILIESGQLEINPPKSLVNFYKKSEL